MNNRQHSKTTRKKISRKLKGRIITWGDKISKSCMGRKAHNIREIGAITFLKDGVRIKVSNDRWMALHRYRVEKYIGYKLKRKWIVHHINGNPLNNNLYNLYIFINRGLHTNFETLVRGHIIDRFILKSNLKGFVKTKGKSK